MAFQFIAGLIDQYTGWVSKATRRKEQMTYSDLMLSMTAENGGKGLNERLLIDLKYGIEQFKRSFVRTFSDHCILAYIRWSSIYWIRLWRACRHVVHCLY